MKPIIGLTCATEIGKGYSYVASSYWQGVAAAGGIPCLLPSLQDEEDIEQLLAGLNGLILTGGPDIHPHYFDQEPSPAIGAVDLKRDEFELTCIRFALGHALPLLAVCRGIQVLNVALGGNLYQDINTEMDRPLSHSQRAPGWSPWHTVSFAPDSLLSRLHDDQSLVVNSFHHQGIKQVAPDLKAIGWTGDGLVEAVESKKYPFVLGVQWHPERMYEKKPAHLREFQWLVERGKEYQR